MQAKRLKSKHSCGTVANTPKANEGRHMLQAARLSSQLEALIVRTEFCHGHITRYHCPRRKAGRQVLGWCLGMGE